MGARNRGGWVHRELRGVRRRRRRRRRWELMN